MEPSKPYAFEVILPVALPVARTAVEGALKAQGFGIITEVDMAAKLKEKLGVDHVPHVLLGACNPRFAHEAIMGNADVALALPCNVVLREEGGNTVVSAMLPSVALKPFAGRKVQEVSCKAEEALSAVFDALVA